jgi:hypothetical protein
VLVGFGHHNDTGAGVPPEGNTYAGNATPHQNESNYGVLRISHLGDLATAFDVFEPAPTLVDVTTPGDPITSFGGNSPANEPVANAINNTTSKYLNFGTDGDTSAPFVGPVGLIVTPSV